MYEIKQSFIKRIRKNLKDCDIAKMMGYHKSTISNIFSGRNQPSKGFIIKACFLFNAKPRDIIK